MADEQLSTERTVEANLDLYNENLINDGDLFSEDFFWTMLRNTSSYVPLPDTKKGGFKDHFDIHLARYVFPVLVPGLEELSKEVERISKDDEKKIDQSIKDWFNPCIYLAEYLMRNNPKFGRNQEFSNLFNQFAKVEKMRRFWKV